MAERIFSGDTALITSGLLEEDEVNSVPVTAVDFTVVSPSGVDLLVNDLPADPEIGDRVGLKLTIIPFNQWDVVEWDGNNWNTIGIMPPPDLIDNTAGLALSGLLTEEPGLYQVRAKFTTTENFIKSDRIWFEAVDPIERANTTPGGVAVDRA
jgi:hypothetical protein